MKNKTQRKPTRSSFSLLRQLCNLIPTHLVPQQRGFKVVSKLVGPRR